MWMCAGCSYFPLFDVFTPMYQRLFAPAASVPSSSPSDSSSAPSHPLLVHFLAGNTAGAVSGVVLNQLTAIKYASWESDRGGFFVTARTMWREGGVQPFMKGIVPTVLRDTIFGGVFALSKEGCGRALNRIRQRAQMSAERRKASTGSSSSGLTAPTSSSAAPTPLSASAGVVSTTGIDLPPSPPPGEVTRAFARSFSRWSDSHVGTIDFVSSLIAGALGTIASSPFNFVRNIKYGWPAKETPPSATIILGQLWTEAGKKAREEGSRQSLSYLQERLRIGWGTARVAVGMAIGYEIYEVVKATLDKAQPAHPSHSAYAARTLHTTTRHSTGNSTTSSHQQPTQPSPPPIHAPQRPASTPPALPPRTEGEAGLGSESSAAAPRLEHALMELPDSASPRPLRHRSK